MQRYFIFRFLKCAIGTTAALGQISIDLTIQNITRINDEVRRRLQKAHNRHGKERYEACNSTCHTVKNNMVLAKTLWRVGCFRDVKNMAKRSALALLETCQIEHSNFKRSLFYQKLQILLRFFDVVETICDLELITKILIC